MPVTYKSLYALPYPVAVTRCGVLFVKMKKCVSMPIKPDITAVEYKNFVEPAKNGGFYITVAPEGQGPKKRRLKKWH